MKKSTISDVAREANVSKATVSRVLNNAPNVADELRERVMEAIQKLDYQPSRAARVLKMNLQDVIGFLIPSITDSIFGAILQSAQDLAYENKIGILAYSTADNLKRQQMYLDNLQAEQVAGIILVPAPDTNPEVLSSVQEQGIPIVLLDRKLEKFDGDCIASDNVKAASSAVNHLIENGYTKIATIAGSQNVSSGIERLNGYRLALEQAKLPINPDWIKFGNFTEKDSYIALKSLIEQDNRPDALFIANDAMTIGALRAIRELDIDIPNELAIIGFDELSLANLLQPTLTTIEQATESIGQESLRMLFDRIQRPERIARIIQFPTRINVRESSRPLHLKT